MRRMVKLALVSAAAMVLLTACRAGNGGDGRQGLSQQQQNIDNRLKTNSVEPPHHAGHPDMRTVPSVDREKTLTTNEYGGTSYGLGSNVYSVIGSSGLHSQGLSSHLESRLHSEGFENIRVFAVDDVVILATDKRRTTAFRYDSLQQKLLGGTSGLSAIGPDTGPGMKIGTKPAGDSATHDNLLQAERWIRDNMGSVQVYTVTSGEAVKTIDRIRSRAGNGQASATQMAGDIRKLLQIAMKGQK